MAGSSSGHGEIGDEIGADGGVKPWPCRDWRGCRPSSARRGAIMHRLPPYIPRRSRSTMRPHPDTGRGFLGNRAARCPRDKQVRSPAPSGMAMKPLTLLRTARSQCPLPSNAFPPSISRPCARRIFPGSRVWDARRRSCRRRRGADRRQWVSAGGSIASCASANAAIFLAPVMPPHRQTSGRRYWTALRVSSVWNWYRLDESVPRWRSGCRCAPRYRHRIETVRPQRVPRRTSGCISPMLQPKTLIASGGVRRRWISMHGPTSGPIAAPTQAAERLSIAVSILLACDL